MNKQRFRVLVLLFGLAIVSALSIVRISAASPLATAVDPVEGAGLPAQRSNNAPTQLVGFSAANYGVGEAEGSAAVTVTLDAASSLTVTVDYATSDGTAIAGSDYLAINGVLTFTSGVTSQTFAVSILDDTLGESDETITLTLSDPTNGTLRMPESATLTILDDDNYIYLPFVMKRWPPIPYTPVLDPISNPEYSVNYTVSWNPADLAQTYTLQEDDNETFSSPTPVYSGSGTSWNASDKPAGTYYYQVKASNTWGDSSWSNVQSVVVQREWVTILSEDFEGAFPGGTWTVRDNDPDSGRYYWGKRNCKPHSGSYSAWSVGAGDSTVSCSASYRDDMYAWMIYGPFSLANATAAELTFDWWSDTEYEYDAFLWTTSIDGNQYYGTGVTGNWSSWTSGERLDFGAVPTLGNLLGRNQVWIAFIFGSDESITDKGSFVDNVVLRKRTGGMVSANQSPPSIQRALRPDQTMEFGEWRLDQPDVWKRSQGLH
jgi:hypothetical protein